MMTGRGVLAVNAIQKLEDDLDSKEAANRGGLHEFISS
jgi:hypothetical protein